MDPIKNMTAFFQTRARRPTGNKPNNIPPPQKKKIYIYIEKMDNFIASDSLTPVASRTPLADFNKNLTKV